MSAKAQEYLDLARFSFTYSPFSYFENGVEADPISELNLLVDLPIPLDDRNAIITSFGTNYINLDLSPSQQNNTDLFAINLRLGLNQSYNEKWSATYLLIPKIATDFSKGLRRGFQLGFVALLNNSKSPRLSYTYGVYTNTEEFGQLIVPLFGGYYLSRNNRWEITALMPALFDLNYKISPSVSVGGLFNGIGTTYSLDNEFFSNAYIARGSNQLFAYSQFKLTSSMFLRTEFGYELRGYKVYDKDDKVAISLASVYFSDKRTLLNTELKDNILFKMELFYRFNLPNKKRSVIKENFQD